MDIQVFTPTSVLENESMIERSPQDKSSFGAPANVQTNAFVSPTENKIAGVGEKNEEKTAKKEVKNYGDLVFFIENKINDEKQNPGQQNNYQKTLFCSPNFKDNIET